MNPNEMLDHAREIAAEIMNGGMLGQDQAYLAGDITLAEKLAGAFQSLDTWLLRGGSKPDAWR